jgi:ABC-type Mn2+/Zn2+ transport system ATPase subunit
MMAVEVKDLSVRLSGQLILDQISFDVESGTITAIIGPNGSGKTTLIRAILGLIPSTGEAIILGEPAGKMIGRLGYVPQRFEFDRTFPLTVEELLYFSLSPAIDPDRIYETAEEIGVAGLLGKMLGELSGGELQRVLIARALLNRPPVLFLDEPTSGVDVKGSKDFYSLVASLRSNHQMTIFIVSHEIGAVRDLADEIICLNRRLVCRGRPEKVLTEAHIAELYRQGFNLPGHHHYD